MSDPWQPPAVPPVPPVSPGPVPPAPTQPRGVWQQPPPPPQAWQQQPAQAGWQQPPPQPGYGLAPYQGGPAPIGQVRSTGISILLFFVTFGIYGYVWYYQTHEEMKRHSGQGLGGLAALLLALFVSIVMPYLTSNEVGDLYKRRGQQPPVSAATGLWYFPGIFIVAGPIIWFVKTNEAINSYWRSLGAV
jgi:hypothetical protein